MALSLTGELHCQVGSSRICAFSSSMARLESWVRHTRALHVGSQPGLGCRAWLFLSPPPTRAVVGEGRQRHLCLEGAGTAHLAGDGICAGKCVACTTCNGCASKLAKAKRPIRNSPVSLSLELSRKHRRKLYRVQIFGTGVALSGCRPRFWALASQRAA